MSKRCSAVTLALILLSSFLLKLHHLDHAALKPLDEVFHAIVSRNLLKHPLTPTLVDHPVLPYQADDWQSNHIWLHKPPMALWQIAVSFATLGVNALALRLPSALLSTAAVWLTYLIGAELLDQTAALIAAALQAFNPVIVMLVHGYVFSDHVDISLLFWTELAIYFLTRATRTGRNVDLLICGFAQGLAILSKTYPALIVSGLAAVAWLLPLSHLADQQNSRIHLRSLLIILAATTLTALPWLIYADLHFPAEFAAENLRILAHLNQNIEGWAAPWDRLAFDYCIAIFHVYYPAILAALIILPFIAATKKQTGLWMILAWAAGVFVPNLVVTSKTMSSTLLGWPAMWLLLGSLVSLAIRGNSWALGAWLTSMLLAVFLLRPSSIPKEGWGYGPPGFASIMRQHLWVLWHLLAALSVGAILATIAKPLPNRLRLPMVWIAAIAMVALAVRCWPGRMVRGYAAVAWDVTQIDKEKPNYKSLGEFAQKLPPQAAFLVDERTKLENKLIEFATNRSCYALQDASWQTMSWQMAATGALPYLISPSPQPLPLVFLDKEDGCAVYACTAPAQSVAEALQHPPTTNR